MWVAVNVEVCERSAATVNVSSGVWDAVGVFVPVGKGVFVAVAEGINVSVAVAVGAGGKN